MPRVARWCSDAAAAIARLSAEIYRELIFALGLVLLASGLALVYVPAALIVPGAILVWLAIPPSMPLRKRT